MKKIIFPLAAVVLLLASAFTFKSAQTWKIADGYSVAFSSADPSGVFNDLKGSIAFDENGFAAICACFNKYREGIFLERRLADDFIQFGLC